MNDDLFMDDLRAKIAARAATIDPELDLQLESAFLRAARERMAPSALASLHAAVAAVRPDTFSSGAIETGSRVPGGSALHLAIAKVVSRQIDGLAQQGRLFGTDVRHALASIAMTIDEIVAATRSDLIAEIDALYERIFVLEHQVRDLHEANRSSP